MYIFLDVDGVLNKRSDWTKPFTLNDECVRNFNELVGQINNAKIVLSSSWRSGISRNGEMAKHVEELMDKLKAVGIDTIDKTAVSPDGSRTKEIDYYLRRHEIDSYIILDDDVSLFEDGKRTRNLYLTDETTGLTGKDVSKILKNIKR